MEYAHCSAGRCVSSYHYLTARARSLFTTLLQKKKKPSKYQNTTLMQEVYININTLLQICRSRL